MRCEKKLAGQSDLQRSFPLVEERDSEATELCLASNSLNSLFHIILKTSDLDLVSDGKRSNVFILELVNLKLKLYRKQKGM